MYSVLCFHVLSCSRCYWSYWSVIPIAAALFGVCGAVREIIKLLMVWGVLLGTAKTWSGRSRPGKPFRIYFDTRPIVGLASHRHYIEEQAPWTCPAAQCSECSILFPSQFHVPSVGRDTELLSA